MLHFTLDQRKLTLLAGLGLILLGGPEGPEALFASTGHGIPHTHTPTSHAHPDRCTCDAARSENGWCHQHRVGWVASVRIPSADLFDMLDAHGHEIEIDRNTCSECHEAWRQDGFCSLNRLGFVDGRAYVSEFAYELARAERRPAPSPCRDRNHPDAGPGWCDACASGYLGDFLFRDPDAYSRTMSHYRRLVAAVDMLESCEACAVASFVDGRCPRCNIHYRNGSAVSGGTESAETMSKERSP